jgi:YVTN family beta-propeller protein
MLAATAALAWCGAVALTAGPAQAAQRPSPAARGAAEAGAREAAKASASGATGAALSPNLLLNPGAQAGAPSARGWDAVTIPGWIVTSGLPTVVRYGTAGFPRATGVGPAVRGGQLFAGGAGGTARLQQVIRLRTAGGRRVPAGTAFRLSAWLGGDRRSRASVTAAFLSAAGKVIGHAGIGPAGGPGAGPPARRSAAGVMPPGAAAVRVTLVLATSVKDIDGPHAPLAGYDWATADDLAFRVSAPVRQPVLTAPAPHVPRYQHVFLFYFENEDYRAVIGNTRQAPFFNSLLPHASVLSDFFAEEHPSDGNYLALAGGSTFGVPLDDPLEEDPKYTIRARNISDLLGAAHETWKAYLQSADGPCDDTVHGYYWDDDMPMTYFADVRDRPAFCASHLVPLQALQTDVSRAGTTPNFAWVSPDDCSDIEGCGIRAGDNFLAAELGAIMRSPAWRTQRSLAIITFDEDGYDHQRPAQRVPTIMIGSAGVRQGYVSHVRYTHYSLLRTIESALGLGTLTANDRYAQPVNDVFVHGAAAARAAARVATAARAVPAGPAAAPAPAVPGAAAPSVGAAAPAAAGLADAGTAPARGEPAHQTAFVANAASDSVTPVDLVTHRAGKAIEVGKDPQAIAISPSGSTAYVVNSGSGTVTPISTVTRKVGRPIRVGNDPQDIAIAPDGRAAYVTNLGSDTVTPVNLGTGQAGPPIRVGAMPRAISITPDGRTAFVLDWGGAAVTPIRLPAGRLAPGPAGRPASLGRAGRAIPVGSYPFAVSIAPDGSTAYVASYGSSTVTPISVASLRAGRPVPAGQATNSVAVAADSATVYAVGGDSDTVTPIAARRGSDAAGRAIPVGYSPAAVAFSASGQTAFVVNTISGTVTPVSTATGRKGRAIGIGAYSYPTAILLAPAGPTAVVVSPYAGQVTLINTARRRAVATVTVGSFPAAVAIAP